MGSIELRFQCRGNSLAWLLRLHPYRKGGWGGGEEGEEKEEGKGGGINKFSVSKVTATFKIIRQIHLFHKCLHFQMPLFGALRCHCP